jgi:hypothetical protein
MLIKLSHGATRQLGIYSEVPETRKIRQSALLLIQLQQSGHDKTAQSTETLKSPSPTRPHADDTDTDVSCSIRKVHSRKELTTIVVDELLAGEFECAASA